MKGTGAYRSVITARAIRRAVVVGLLTAALAGCGSSASGGQQPSGNKPDVNLVHSGKLTGCTHLPAPPWESRENGKVVGFDVELLTTIAKELGLSFDIIDAPWEGIQSGADLNARKCDIGFGAMTITEERAKRISFSHPYFDADQALTTLKTNDYTKLVDLVGKRVGVQNGSTGQIYLRAHAPDGVTEVEFNGFGTLTQALKSGSVSAIVFDAPAVLSFAKKNPGVVVRSTFPTGEQYGLALRKTGSTQLLAVVNRVLAKSMEPGGIWADAYRKFIGPDVPEPPQQ